MAGVGRIVCLSAESADVCARVGVWERVVGVTAYADQRGLAPKPVVSSFSKAEVARVLEFRPDLAFTFSDVQAAISAELIRAGVTVVATNPRSLSEIAESIELIGRVVGREADGRRVVKEFLCGLDEVRLEPVPRLRVYFEEWPEPPISGIGWVSELISLCGGLDVFAERGGAAAKDREVTLEQIISADPEVILASWCGKRVEIDAIRKRPGFEAVSAVKQGRIFSIESADLLSPGPRLITGAREIRRILDLA